MFVIHWASSIEYWHYIQIINGDYIIISILDEQKQLRKPQLLVWAVLKLHRVSPPAEQEETWQSLTTHIQVANIYIPYKKTPLQETTQPVLSRIFKFK